MKHTIVKETEIEILRDMVIEIRHGNKQLWNYGYVLSIFEMYDPFELFVLVRVKDFADHAYPLANLKEDNGTLYFMVP